MVELGGAISFFTPFLNALKGIIVVGFPLFIVGVLILVSFIWMRNQRMYKYKVVIWRGTDNNTVEGYDKGAIIKRGDLREFRLRKRRLSLSVPDDKYIMINEKGGFTIYFDKFGDIDLKPVEIKRQLVEIKRVGNPYSETIKGFTSKIVPSESDSRNFHVQKMKELILRHQTISKLEKFAPFVGYAIVGVVFIFMIIWYFKFASVLADKGSACMDQVAGLAEACKQSLIPPR